jgi:hypothetical protein
MLIIEVVGVVVHVGGEKRGSRSVEAEAGLLMAGPTIPNVILGFLRRL